MKRCGVIGKTLRRLNLTRFDDTLEVRIEGRWTPKITSGFLAYVTG